jgi:crotonobetainyl-CoA:carnitine CoA-transferase CaiB-like acyl-CoA transferase
MGGVLEGVRLLDFGRYIAGPFCSRRWKAMIPEGPVLSPQQALDHPHIRAAGFMQDVDYPGLPKSASLARAAVRLSETPGEIVARPPTLGEHTDLVLAELGYDTAAIAALRQDGIIERRQPPRLKSSFDPPMIRVISGLFK